LIVAALCVAVWLFPQGRADGANEPGRDGSGHVKGAGAVLLFLGFVCVWWSETLGDALWAGHGAWNPVPSSGSAWWEIACSLPPALGSETVDRSRWMRHIDLANRRLRLPPVCRVP